ALAAMRATLDSTLLADDYARMVPLARRWADGVRDAFTEHDLPWTVNQLGARAEYWFSPPPRNGAEAAAAVDEELDSLMHLWALNRGILLTPFHNMALMSPSTTADDVDAHTAAFQEAVAALMAPSA
ncbi:MAG: glutamate-semialdehyde -aminomutase, partial [Actinomycetota bacterium]|nr:glutamate-semialdehyde -aminomutase [Actinomycetota bacterium]